MKSREFTVGYGVVHPWQIDQFGHLNVRWYAHFFDDASFQLMTRLGLDMGEMVANEGVHTVTAQTTTRFEAELRAGTCIEIFGCVKKVGQKSLTLQFRLASAAGAKDHAHYEAVEVFVDAQTHKSVLIPDHVRQRLAALDTSHIAPAPANMEKIVL